MIEDTSQFNEDFIKNYNEESDKGYFPEVDVHYTEKWHELHHNLPFLPKIMKTEKFDKVLANLNDKTCYICKKIKTNIKSWIGFEKSKNWF